MSGAGKLTASFRKAGLNYLEYLNTQTTALRSVLKEPMRSEVMGRTSFSYRAFTYPAGVESKPREFSRLAGAEQLLSNHFVSAVLVSNDSVKVEE